MRPIKTLFVVVNQSNGRVNKSIRLYRPDLAERHGLGVATAERLKSKKQTEAICGGGGGRGGKYRLKICFEGEKNSSEWSMKEAGGRFA